MERIELYQEWLANEVEIAKLLEALAPLLERRHTFESEVPELGLLRDQRTVPGEEPPKLARQTGGSKSGTLLLGTRVPLVGDAERKVPTIEDFQRVVESKRKSNRRKHEKAKAKKKAKLDQGVKDPVLPPEQKDDSSKMEEN